MTSPADAPHEETPDPAVSREGERAPGDGRPGLSLLVYAVLRLAAFLVPFALMMLLPAFHGLWWLAAIFAALIGLSISVLFLRRPLGDVSQSLAARREAAERAPRAKTEREIEDELENEANDEARRG